MSIKPLKYFVNNIQQKFNVGLYAIEKYYNNIYLKWNHLDKFDDYLNDIYHQMTNINCCCCYECDNCINCACCIGSDNLINCFGCEYCENCKDCISCNVLDDCIKCISCDNCKNIYNCYCCSTLKNQQNLNKRYNMFEFSESDD